jgi:hypothetical protein
MPSVVLTSDPPLGSRENALRPAIPWTCPRCMAGRARCATTDTVAVPCQPHVERGNTGQSGAPYCKPRVRSDAPCIAFGFAPWAPTAGRPRNAGTPHWLGSGAARSRGCRFRPTLLDSAAGAPGRGSSTSPAFGPPILKGQCRSRRFGSPKSASAEVAEIGEHWLAPGGLPFACPVPSRAGALTDARAAQSMALESAEPQAKRSIQGNVACSTRCVASRCTLVFHAACMRTSGCHGTGRSASDRRRASRQRVKAHAMAWCAGWRRVCHR